ncbi:hypothetical protein E2C01_003221 [Portunus trituberculatus]|uniref:Uncharacterized protein n=1 Tax=Portunus trituberculatus TaxID=210409 RepID=A0A5B7CPM6_PORTR|nr:hypothetical protein [Portunus trituberculatus]
MRLSTEEVNETGRKAHLKCSGQAGLSLHIYTGAAGDCQKDAKWSASQAEVRLLPSVALIYPCPTLDVPIAFVTCLRLSLHAAFIIHSLHCMRNIKSTALTGWRGRGQDQG